MDANKDDNYISSELHLLWLHGCLGFASEPIQSRAYGTHKTWQHKLSEIKKTFFEHFN